MGSIPIRHPMYIFLLTLQLFFVCFGFYIMYKLNDLYGTDRLGRLLAISLAMSVFIVFLGVITPNYSMILVIVWSITTWLGLRNFANHHNLSWKDDFKKVVNIFIETLKKTFQND